jgi:Flp pilus assembly protein TadD
MIARLAAGLLALALVAAPSLGVAAQKDPRLDPLFERLKDASSPNEARGIEAQIWQIWTKADDSATDSLMRLALEAMQRNDMKGAFVLFDAITTQNPNFAEGWNKRATVLFSLGAYDEAIAACNKTLELEPRHFGALSGLGLIRMQKNQDTEALKAFEDAFKLSPHLPGVKSNIETLRKKIAKGAI